MARVQENGTCESMGMFGQAQILESSSVSRADADQRIRCRRWGSSADQLQRYREENDMATDEMRREIRPPVDQIRINIGSEIDTDVWCEHVGMIPDGGLEIRSVRGQEGMGRPLGKETDRTRMLYKEGDGDELRRVFANQQSVLREMGRVIFRDGRFQNRTFSEIRRSDALARSSMIEMILVGIATDLDYQYRAFGWT